MGTAGDVSCVTLNRLSVYLRCLRSLQGQGTRRVSSKELARRFQLSAPQIRKDLAQFGEFGVRGVGYDVGQLVGRLTEILQLDHRHCLVVVGMGNLGMAIARHVGFSKGAFRVVAGFDVDPAKIGRRAGRVHIYSSSRLGEIVARTAAEIAVLSVPAAAAQSTYDAIVAAGIRGVLNFAPIQLRQHPAVYTRGVDLRTHLEELVFFLSREPAIQPRGTIEEIPEA